MAVYSILVALRGWYTDAPEVPFEDFLGALQVKEIDAVESVQEGREYASAIVTLSITRLRDFKTSATPSGAMFEQLDKNLLLAADFLNQRPPSVFEEFRQRGLTIDIFIDVWMNQDQMEFSFPWQFLEACGRAQLQVNMLSNDIPAGDLEFYEKPFLPV